MARIAFRVVTTAFPEAKAEPWSITTVDTGDDTGKAIVPAMRQLPTRNAGSTVQDEERKVKSTQPFRHPIGALPTLAPAVAVSTINTNLQ